MEVNLKHGDWVLVDGGDDNEPIWLVSAFETSEGNNCCQKVNVSNRTERYSNELNVRRNNVAINIV